MEEKVEMIQEEEENKNIVTEEKPKKKKKFLLPSILIGIIILLLVGFYFYQEKLISKNKKTDKVDGKEVYSEYRMSGNGLENFDLYFLQLENNQKNMVYSPLSIKYALAMLNEASDGQTKQQITAVIGDYQARKYPNNEHMSFANAMFIRNSFQDSVNENYIKILKEKYNAEVILDPFENPNNINNWVSDKTFKLVNNLVDDVKDQDFFLINALAIDMLWNNQLHCAEGHKAPCMNNGIYSIYYRHEKIDDKAGSSYGRGSVPYYSEESFPGISFDGKENIKTAEILGDFNRYDIIKELGEEHIRSTVTEAYKKWLETDAYALSLPQDSEDRDVQKSVDRYMEELKANYGKSAISTDFSLHVEEDVKVFTKDLQTYDGTTLQYVGIMPRTKKLKDYIQTIQKEDISELISKAKEAKIESFKEGVATRIVGNIPFFQFEYELDLMEDLKQLGIEDVFEEKADLSNLSKGAIINKSIHKANIEFSNDGIKAAAATAMGGAGATSGGFEYLWTIPVEEIDITFDQPYLFLIRDKDSGEVWFAGTVYEPITK